VPKSIDENFPSVLNAQQELEEGMEPPLKKRKWSPDLLANRLVLTRFLDTHSLNSRWEFQQGIVVVYQNAYSFALTLHVPQHQVIALEGVGNLTPGIRSVLIRQFSKEWCATFQGFGSVLWRSGNDNNFNRDIDLFGKHFSGNLHVPGTLVALMKMLENLQACQGFFVLNSRAYYLRVFMILKLLLFTIAF